MQHSFCRMHAVIYKWRDGHHDPKVKTSPTFRTLQTYTHAHTKGKGILFGEDLDSEGEQMRAMLVLRWWSDTMTFVVVSSVHNFKQNCRNSMSRVNSGLWELQEEGRRLQNISSC